MKKLVFMTLTVIGLSVVFGTTASAQAKPAPKKVAVEAQPVKEKKDLPGPDAAPREKSTRGYCYVYFDNFTGNYVDVWVENIYQGRLSPYAKSVRIDVWVPGNWTKWYAQTTDGSLYWSNSSYCNDSRVFTLNLKR
ncbi:MAG TPA: hypothetical protein PKE63_09460 [Lacibacter sp.]|nr:hypothetical protein [Lacibacter sp.]HMO88917.1 hypothetical protein [Lacibacter sp.]HMP87492.1 hypothetical protein [Lacibacter sp.]